MSSGNTMKFEQALQYMDPMQVTDYLQKTLDFLQRNNSELCFPNITPYTESFLVNLVTDTRNLKCNSFHDEDKELGQEIIEVLEMSRDVFRWTHTYENTKLVKNLLVYKKIYSNKIKNKHNIKLSSIANRLIQAQASGPSNHNSRKQASNTAQADLPTISTSFKLSFLNETLRFLNTNAQTTHMYKEMPLSQAEYIQSLLTSQNGGGDVGFGFKSLYGRLWEAMDKQSVNFVLKVTLQVTNDNGFGILKIEKIPRNNNTAPKKDKVRDSANENLNNAHEDEAVSKTCSKKSKLKQSLNPSSGCTCTVSQDPNIDLNSISTQFMTNTVAGLTRFAADAGRGSVSFHRLTPHEMAFVNKVKRLAASAEEREKFTPHFRSLLLNLDESITNVLKTCKITRTIDEKRGSIILKKKPIFATPAVEKQSPSITGTRSESPLATESVDRSLSKGRKVTFQTSTPPSTTKKVEPTTDAAPGKERGRSKETGALNKRKAKLLEDMSTPVESEKGLRMMRLMGWKGGALGTRQDGITEPLIPAIELPPGAGLGHVPPPKQPKPQPVMFRLTLLHDILDLLLHDDPQKQIQYKEPMSRKQRSFLRKTLNSFNGREGAGLNAAEAELSGKVLQELQKHPELSLRAHVSDDLRTVTLLKVKNGRPLQTAKQDTQKPKANIAKKNPVKPTTEDDADVVVTKEDIEAAMLDVDVSSLEYPDSVKAIKKRATRMVYLKKLARVLNWHMQEIKFKYTGTMQKVTKAFLSAVVESLSNPRCSGSFLLEPERPLYSELRRLAAGCQLAIMFEQRQDLSYFTLTKKRLFTVNKPLDSVRTTERNNNNEERTLNKNQNIHATEVTKEIDDQNSLKVSANIVVNKDILETGVNETECDKIAHNDMNSDVVTDIKKEIEEYNDGETDLEADNLDKDIQDLVMAVFKAEIDCSINKENDTDLRPSDIEMAKSVANHGIAAKNKNDYQTLLSDLEKVTFEADVTKENDNLSSGNKRSYTNLNDTLELNAKRSRFGVNENIIIISPNNPNEKMNRDVIEEIQNLISDEIDNASGNLPLLKCLGVKNNGLVYGCQDREDVAWLKNVIGVANLDLKIIAGDDSCLDSKNRKMVIKINSCVYLDAQKTFCRFETYNTGLDTKSWKVLSSQMINTFYIMIVEVDEKSFKYISDKNFSLYCGIDKAHFSAIF